MKKLENGINGILPVDKEIGISSYDVIRKLKPFFPRKFKIGHAGTLDPFASGLLLILLGKGTKISSKFLDTRKKYRFTMEFGYETDTQDPTGEKVAEDKDREEIDIEMIKENLRSFIGLQKQMPPIYSAKKVGGKSSYKYARKGIKPKLEPKEIEIYSLAIMEYKWPELSLDTEVSSGTYIRTLSVDIANSLARHATTTKLRRMAIGDYTLEGSFPSISIGKEDFNKFIVPLDE